MELIKKNNRHYFSFRIFKQFPELLAVVTSRLNLGFAVGDNQNTVIENRKKVASDLGIKISDLVGANQVHGSRVVVATNATQNAEALPDGSHQLSQTDGLITDQVLQPVMILTADCAPVFLFDQQQKVICLIHVGWRGVINDIILAAVQQMQHKYQTLPQDILVGVGPCLGVESYQVQAEFVSDFQNKFDKKALGFFDKKTNGWYFDLEKVIKYQLKLSNISSHQIELSGMSTAQNLDYFYSHRAEQGVTGRFGSIMMLKPSTLF